MKEEEDERMKERRRSIEEREAAAKKVTVNMIEDALDMLEEEEGEGEVREEGESLESKATGGLVEEKGESEDHGGKENLKDQPHKGGKEMGLTTTGATVATESTDDPSSGAPLQHTGEGEAPPPTHSLDDDSLALDDDGFDGDEDDDRQIITEAEI
mmetsp:Transcript_6736/g.9328  ORF Transcript_6736/g.9328 Transcript_6736/m.9328 type:complete len:156 (+) Transcript_6736:102-569(+)